MAEFDYQGPLAKMLTTHSDPIRYQLVMGEQHIDLNALMGHRLHLNYLGQVHCQACGRKGKKSFGQGYCYPCFRSLPQCDSCMMKPETCHFDAGTCRDEEWAREVCMHDHIVYLANSSSLKVGITRISQVPVRWMDQGASQALPIYRVASRRLSGLVEVIFKQHVSDRTSWQAMLKGAPEPQNLREQATRLFDLCREPLAELEREQGIHRLIRLDDAKPYDFTYPVSRYPTKVKAFNFDKEPLASGVLEGIKGQYLIFDTGVLNVRKFSGYLVGLSLEQEHV
ncbi:DUF2797 domain-containing protein [Aestuariirhabdus sp. Z084]|uniref:DUF2797 domain-containing protein n=1 Tax=Aestuariirhabdus haliotis TaxID=2918751 RepID=UPI00201B3737|nr:DUF2797 domain-containing protein [Aestuariirhabdus haliotis]MCL6414725.1 DUF2797 domain-containing protein [Aestuariirhabdus haliotis]MCL6418657.1 DUF2797 domain-containing protein [Aestuariirhabdus haliotis]